MQFWPRVVLILWLLAAISFSWQPLRGGDDFWAHAAIGRWVLENQQVPRQTLFLWSAEMPWVFHAYGSGVVFAALLQVGGAMLALAFNALAAVLPFWLIWFWWRKNRPFASIFAGFLMVAIWVSSVRWHVRPELFSALFLSLVLLYFLGARSRLSQIGLVLIFALWPNLHGGVLLGIVTLWATAFAQFFDERESAGGSWVLALGCTLAAFAGNPYGFDYAATWLDVGGTTFSQIEEWKPIWQTPFLAIETFAGLALVWGTAALCWAKDPEKKVAHLVWLLLFGAAFLVARRQIWLVSLASLIVLANYSSALSSEAVLRWLRKTQDDGFRRVARLGLALFLLCGIGGGLARMDKPFAILSDDFPVGVARELEKWPKSARLFNDYENSAALEWRLYGRREFYIDLINAYPPALLREYLDILAVNENGLRALDARRIEIVALRDFERGERLEKLANWLDENPNWRRVYYAQDGTVWVRRSLVRARNVAQGPPGRPRPKATPS